MLEPLHALRLQVEAPEHGLRADLTFVRRSAPIEEPHFFHQVGVRVMFDYTRLTQFGGVGGLDRGRRRVYRLRARRDRGVARPLVGGPPRRRTGPAGAPVADPQFFWLWAPVNFAAFVHPLRRQRALRRPALARSRRGRPGRHGRRRAPEAMRTVEYRIAWSPGTRHASAFEYDLVPWVGDPSTIRLEPMFNFQMLGIGYGHPEWSTASGRANRRSAATAESARRRPDCAPSTYTSRRSCRATSTGRSRRARGTASSNSWPSARTQRPDRLLDGYCSTAGNPDRP